LYVSVRRKLLEHVTARLAPGGKLPPERELCQIMGVSNGTLRKALDKLGREGRVISSPRKGHYLSRLAPPSRIGLIFGDGEFALLGTDAALAGGALDVIGQAGYYAHILLLRQDAEKELGKHDLDGILWLNPPVDALPLIGRMVERATPPLFVLSLWDGKLPGYKIPLAKGLMAFDFAAVGRLRAEYFLSRKIGRVAYLGDDDDDNPTFKTFASQFDAAGDKFDPRWHFRDIPELLRRLPEFLDGEGAAGVVSNGGVEVIETLFRTLVEHGGADRVEVLPDLVSGMAELLRRYPGVKVEHVNALDSTPHDIGAAAAAVLIEQIRTGAPAPRTLFRTRLQTLEEALKIQEAMTPRKNMEGTRP